MAGTSGAILSLVTDKYDNVYAGSNNGIVYKCLWKQTIFTEIKGTSSWILSLTTDKDGNVYAGNQWGSIYKCLWKQTIFTEFKKLNHESINSLVTDKNGNVYAGTTEANNILKAVCIKAMV